METEIRCEVMLKTESWPFVHRCDNSSTHQAYTPEGIDLAVCDVHAAEARTFGAVVKTHGELSE